MRGFFPSRAKVAFAAGAASFQLSPATGVAGPATGANFGIVFRIVFVLFLLSRSGENDGRGSPPLMEAIHFIQDLAVILVVAGVVGWVCQRLGLSTVVGYLAAGLVVGPYTPPFALVTDIPRVDTLAQLGLVFLMFSLGLRLSLRKLQRLGLSLMLAVAVSAGVIYALTRLMGAAVGLNGVESLFLAGMLMVSSSAIISKVLLEVGATHERSGQLAMGVVVLEDVVAVMMLT
jgi:CPA2 family monovalent cation:H+ antiporter-2